MPAKQPKRVAIYAPALSEYAHDLAEGVLLYAQKHPDYVIRHFQFGSEAGEPVRPPRWRNWQPDGVVAFAGQQEESFEWLYSRGVPVVNTTPDCPRPLPCVFAGHRSIARLAADHFIKIGFEHFGYVGVPDHVGMDNRGNAFVEELSRHGYSADRFNLMSDPGAGLNHQIEDASEEPHLREFLERCSKPIGIFAGYDGIARAVCTACQDLEIEIPGAVAVVGVNDSTIARLGQPTITTIRLPGEEVGYKAMEILAQLLQEERVRKKIVEIPSKLIVIRESTGQQVHREANVDRAMRLIQRHACEGIRVADIARKLGISRTTLEQHFHQIFDTTPGEEISRARTDRAKELLTETTLSIEAISQMVGYATVSNFGEFFRRRTGMPPRKYRQTHRATIEE